MSAPVPFDYSGQEVRVVEIDGAPWWVAADVAATLGYTRSSDVARFVDDEDRGTEILRTLSGDQSHVIVNESGLFSILTSSRRPEAKPFRRWVTGTVLPALRKNGTYTMPGAEPTTEVAEVDPFDTLQGMLDRLRENRDMAVRALMGIADHEVRITSHEDRLVAIESNPGWLTSTGWAVLRGWPQTDVTTLGRLGKRAAAIARTDGLEESKVLDINGRYYVHRWPAHVWDEAARRLGQLS
jgi:prophage antirepressor-like protein